MLRPNYTPERFRELAEGALAELIDNSDALEIHDVRTWGRRLGEAVARAARYEQGAGSVDEGGDEE
ncbi:MAG TPA: hypothetical protein VF092_28165 [Longimicrobium sp.]